MKLVLHGTIVLLMSLATTNVRADGPRKAALPPNLGMWAFDLGVLGPGLQYAETHGEAEFALRGHIGLVHRFSGSRSREAMGIGLTVGWPLLDHSNDAVDVLVRIGGFACIGTSAEFSAEALIGPGFNVYQDRVFGDATVAALRGGARLDLRHYPDRNGDGQFFVGGTLMGLTNILGDTFFELTVAVTVGYTFMGIKTDE